MFISIRRYRHTKEVPELARRVQEELVPIMRDLPGFMGYYALDAGDGVVASVSMFESEEAALRSNERAAAWVRERLAVFFPEPPEITAGESLAAISGS